MNALIAAALTSVPVVKSAGVATVSGTTFDSPATTRIGDLIIGCRGTTGGGIQGMGSDFTDIGSEGTGPYDINCGWRIATANGVTSHTIASGGANIFWVLIRRGTFKRSDPCPTSLFAASQQDHNNAVWPSCVFARTRYLAIAGTYNSSIAVLPTRIPGSYPLWNSTSPYSRGFAKLGGWPALDLNNTSGDGTNGTAGQFVKIWSFAVAPA